MLEPMSLATTSRPPRWYTIPVRVGLVTLIGTLLSFCVSLLLAIAGTVIVGAYEGVHPQMTVAYRRIALPTAVVGGAVIFVLTLITEIRHYRRGKVLPSMERVG